jgi:hypothetical protein
VFENIKAGWALGKQVRKLVFSDRGLILYPILSAVVVFAEMLLIFLSFFLAVPFTYSQGPGATYILALFIFYLVSTFTSTYILVALLLAFRAYASGKRISLGDAFSQTRRYAKLILEWAIFYSVVIMVVRLIEARLGAIGRIIFGLAAGVAIGVATIFVVPVIIDNKVGPIHAMKQSAEFFIRNFGKTFGGLMYSDLYNLMFIAGGIAIIIIGALALSTSAILGITVAALGLILLVFGIIMNFLTINVFKLILFDYMNGKALPSGISEDLMKQSIQKSRKQAPPGAQPQTQSQS